MRRFIKIVLSCTIVLVCVFSFQHSGAANIETPIDNPITSVASEHNKLQVCAVEEVDWEIEVKFDNIYDHMIYYAAKDTMVDPYLAISISRLETGHYTSRAFREGYNFGGVTVVEGLREYDSLNEGLYRFIRLLEWYYSEGMDTAEKIQPVYCPPNDDWDEVVNSIYKKFI